MTATTTTHATVQHGDNEPRPIAADGFATVEQAFANARGAHRVAGFSYVDDVTVGTMRVVTMRRTKDGQEAVLRMWQHDPTA